MSYRDYLVYEATSSASALMRAVVLALPMENEGVACGMLEQALKEHTGLTPRSNPERVEERPKGANF